ncbi:unnamed protein product [Parajaminaea phylloscopi]
MAGFVDPSRPSMVVEELVEEDGQGTECHAPYSPFAGGSGTSTPHSVLRSPEMRAQTLSNAPIGSSSQTQHGLAPSSSSSAFSHRKASWHGHTSWPGLNSLPSGTTSSSQSAAAMQYGSSIGHGAESASQSHAHWPSSASQNHHENDHAANRAALRRRPIRFRSRLIRDGDVPEKPWLESKTRKRADRKAYWVFVACILVGLAAAAGLVYSGVAEVPTYKYCQILDEQFDGNEINADTWFHELETGGFGNGEFEWTTKSPNNSYVQDGMLHIVPTLTADSLGPEAVVNGYTLNLTADGTCTASNKSDFSCAVASNASTGVVLPPVQSARLITNFSTTIKYGRIEVRARMPTGDWIWPAVWMMPKDSVYGAWPKSGEIDIFESRGNAVTGLNSDASNRMRSSLHWGPDPGNDRYLETTDNRQLYRNFYNEEFHTFGLEWTPEGIYTWEQSPIHKVFSYKFKQDFWTKGTFPTTSSNGTVLHNPWPQNSTAAPFNQEFFLILSVAVGGTNGYFDQPDMPWSNNAENARRDFWAAKNTWYPTWPQDPAKRGMVVDYVKVYQMDGISGKECPAGAQTSTSWKS